MDRAALRLLAILGAVLIFAAACGGEEATPTFTTARTVPPEPTVAPEDCSPDPTLEISVNGVRL